MKDPVRGGEFPRALANLYWHPRKVLRGVEAEWEPSRGDFTVNKRYENVPVEIWLFNGIRIVRNR